jgi:hypothetical protein
MSPWRTFHSCFEESTTKLHISPQITYCVYATISCMEKKITHKKAQTLDSMFKFSIGSLQCGPCSTIIYCALPYIRHRVLGEIICLSKHRKRWFICTHLYRQKFNDCSINIY